MRTNEVYPYSIKNILDYYKNEVDNPLTAHDEEYFLIKKFVSSLKEIKLIIFNRKCLYYELKFPVKKIEGLDEKGHIQSVINDYVDYVDYAKKSHNEKIVLFARDLSIFYPEDINNPSKNPKPMAIDEKIHSLYKMVF